MAVINETVENPIKGLYIVTWGPMLNGDTGRPFVCGHFQDKTVQVEGTFGVGGNARIEGSNYSGSETWATLSDPQGTALDIVAADPHVEAVLENPFKIRPNITAGDGTTSLTVKLAMMARE